MKRVLFKTAARQLGANKAATLFMCAGIMVGIAVLTIVIALSQGTKARILERIDRMAASDTFTVRTSPWGQGGGGMGSNSGAFLLSFEDILSLQEQIPGVTAALPALNARGTVTSGKSVMDSVSVQGVVQEFQQVRNSTVQSGSFFSDFDIKEGSRTAIVGPAVANHFFPGENPVGEMIQVEGMQLEVIGVLTSRGATGKGSNADEIILVPHTLFTKMFQPAGLSTVTVKVDNIADVERLADETKAFLEALHPGQEIYVRVPMTTVGTRQETSRTLSLYLTVVAIVALLVGGVVMMNLTSLSISARTREIGLRKALGARNRDISQQILFETAMISALAGLTGILLGILLTILLTARLELQALLSWHAPVAGLIFALLIGLLFGVRPANRAARLDPVTALRSVG
ncbi:MAG: ABC transporter permease [Dethiobacter sp.]|jgi:ABC-type antimicrobial peptide transport system permease subunit|nr:ABC transporter permease [Dethiobacter sp.]